jgi:hypothetical protein
MSHGLGAGLVAALGAAVITIPVAAQEAKVFVLTPPEVILTGVKKLAILDLASDGDYGPTFSGYLIEHLMDRERGIHELKTGFLGAGGAKRGETLQEGAVTNVFELVERSRLAQVLNEQRLGSSGIVEESQAAQVGKILGVDAVIMGNLAITRADKPERRQYTSEGRTYLVNCVKREVNVAARVRITDVETATILGSAERSRSGKSEKCEPRLADLLPTAELVNQAAREAAADVADYVAPRFELREFGLRRIRGKETEALAKRAGDAAEALRVDEAFVIYKSLYDKDPYMPELAYNLGILSEMVGNQTEAAEYYSAACQLKDEKDCRKAVERTTHAAAFQESLTALGVRIAQHEFGVTAEALARATARNLETRGNREDRVTVFAEPREGSEVMTAVPGGLTFQIAAEEGEWYRIRLLGGKEGYVHRDKVKVKDK